MILVCTKEDIRIEDSLELSGLKSADSPGEMEIYISIHDGVENPVTGEKGGGFFVGSFKDALDHFRCDWD